MKNTSPKDAIKEDNIPICFIHGKDDAFISYQHSVINSESTKGYKELHLIDGAAHAMSREILGEKTYTNIVREFLGNINK